MTAPNHVEALLPLNGPAKNNLEEHEMLHLSRVLEIRFLGH